MIDRVCISINNRCNLHCEYCHFHEKEDSICPDDMDVFAILNNVRDYIDKYNVPMFKVGFVGNGEPFLDYDLLKICVLQIEDLLNSGKIRAYTITNGTCIDTAMMSFMKDHKVNIGFSLDGPREIHNKYRCDTFDKVMDSIEKYQKIHGRYPALNCTVGREALDNPERMVSFFSRFDSRITFSRMIGGLGIPLKAFREFVTAVQGKLSVRTGGYDCTMYGGLCGAGINNFFYSNSRIYICGNCIDLESLPYDTPLDQIAFSMNEFDRNCCYKETISL